MLVSDNVPPYDSHNFKIYYKRRGIRHRPVTELRPQGNAMAWSRWPTRQYWMTRVLEENKTILHFHSKVRHQLKYSWNCSRGLTCHHSQPSPTARTRRPRSETRLPWRRTRETLTRGSKPKTRRLRMGTRSLWPDARPQPRHPNPYKVVNIHQQPLAEEWENIPNPGQVGGAHVQAGGRQPGGGQDMVPARPHLGGRNDPTWYWHRGQRQ